MNSSRILVLGLQACGKTTFAAGLWHLVDSKEMPTRLEKGRHTGDYSHLEEIAQLWCDGWQVKRTNENEAETVHINLKDPKTQKELTLEFTDLAGETFDKAYITRHCSASLVDLVKSADGILLFVSANRMVDNATILDVFGDSSEDDKAPEESAAAPGIPLPKWDPATTPLQIKLVDILQALQLPPFLKPRARVAVVISAWDLSHPSSSPVEWFNNRFPLLNQYLHGPFGAIETKVFGISAQGGELPKKEDGTTPERTRLLAITPASKRIKVASTGSESHDLTLPVSWLNAIED